MLTTNYQKVVGAFSEKASFKLFEGRDGSFRQPVHNCHGPVGLRRDVNFLAKAPLILGKLCGAVRKESSRVAFYGHKVCPCHSARSVIRCVLACEQPLHFARKD